ncbi:NAD(P)/FAD-dependent oxidoreductase [Alloyangia pacifica]|uniref:Glycine/D-amino acid oxidase n=1 Tax=Alloyangia pacifica TaxID=311180 RepID=A0A1I6RMY6_9RHOB|nr:FAD-binding oxidoreductase [Alloyangia pacifica]SDG53472.1 Glycine/D-amino acid oxidase [Alloyangia pacifica]SFS66016.1 Glycine/D-amino acid oxidase [Alloyangia pacifica]
MARYDDIYAEDFKDTPYWWEAAAPETNLDPLPAQSDVVIVGSGYAGLNAATHLARAGKSVVVLDCDRIGEGCSTRSGGMVSSGQKLVVGGAIRGIDPALVSRLIGESNESFDFLKTLIETEKLDAGLTLSGRFFGAHAAKDYEILKRHGQLLQEKTGVHVHQIPREAQRSVIGSDYYHGGIVIDEYGGLHPGMYHRALRERAKAAGVLLRSNARAGITKDGPNGTKIVPTSRGEIRTDDVIVATNGYTHKDTTPELASRVVPVKSYQIATEALPADLLAELIRDGRMVSDSRRDLIYARVSPDGTRLLFGSRPGALDMNERRAAKRIYARMLAIWPQLEGVKITHSWIGSVAMTRDKIAHIGERDNAHFTIGCNGNGVALMTYLGHQMARKILNQQNQPSAFDREKFTAVPFYSGKPWFLPAFTGWYRLRDFIDRPRGS